ncbi:MAG: phenylalanine--tRNA ligase subunit alpha [Gemmatimonadetes bacterium]|nr:phenylalanine--tRNA ligase subunit alpha [Gemmatimonadota bacterium]
MADVDITSLHALEIKTLRGFESDSASVQSDGALGEATGLGAGQIRRAVEWLISKSLLEIAEESSDTSIALTDLGKTQLSAGASPESALLTAAAEGSVTLKDLQGDERFSKGDWGSAFGGLKKEGVIDTDGPNIVIKYAGRAHFYSKTLFDDLIGPFGDDPDGTLAIETFSEELQVHAREAATGPGKSKSPVRLVEQVVRFYRLTGDGATALESVITENMTGEEVSQLTPDMLQSSSWKSFGFRRYDLSIKPPRIQVGRHHAYRTYLDGVRRKLLSLGFEEMKGPLVETEFWNMDALFMPQFHAARNIHDAYFISEPSESKVAEEPFFSKVGQAHRDGGNTESRGWRYPFDSERSKRLLMRTQGTAISARTMAAGPSIPGKYFAIARCFRPDEIDATHGAEFNQVEGIVLGDSINFRSLLGLLKLFALEVAQAEEVRYVPDYFPFTEPSVELQAKHPTLGWIELGGAGLFRPELTQPLGIDVPVIAWGLGVDRMAMVSLGIKDIRDLFSTDLEYLRNQR